jgi:integrase
MIEDHYGHVNTIKHADRVLMGIGGWDAMHAELDADHSEADAKASRAAATRNRSRSRPNKPS